MRSIVCWAVMGAMSAAVLAQAPRSGQRQPRQSDQSTGTVTGYVYDETTHKPVRLATVMVSPLPDLTRTTSVHFSGPTGMTNEDGAFTILNAPIGDVLVTAIAPGYVSADETVRSVVASGGTIDEVIRAMSHTRVSVVSVAQATVMLRRGGVLSGRVQWGDGSPATNITMQVQSVPSQSNPRTGATFMTIGNNGYRTDDRGYFRISGLAEGDYTVSAQFSSPVPEARNGGMSMHNIYAPAELHRSRAEHYSVVTGGERDGVDIVIDIASLPSVRGHLVTPQGYDSPTYGTVTLRDQGDPSFWISGTLTEGSNFTVPHVPPGNYDLDVTVFVQGSSGVQESLQSAKQTIVMTNAEIKDMSIALTPRRGRSVAVTSNP